MCQWSVQFLSILLSFLISFLQTGHGYASYPLTPPHFSVGNVSGFGSVQVINNQARAIVVKYNASSGLFTVRLKVHVVNAA